MTAPDSRHTGHRTQWLAPSLILIAMILTALAYRPGLGGPLLLDDFDNLAPVSQYLDGRVDASRVIFGNESGPLGRPIAMASFLLDAIWFGNDTRVAKRTNLFAHLANGWLLFLLAHRIIRRLAPGIRDPQLLAAMVATVWLLLPVHASSVLYLVQRMALLSTFFVLAGLLWYVAWRERLEQGRGGGVALWLGLPLFVTLAALSKENGLLLLPLAALVEWCCFQPARGERRPRAVLALHATLVGIPALAAVALVTLRPDVVLAGYEWRHFSLAERLLTQPRVLWDYVRVVLIPHTPSLGLFHDDYTVSTGLLSPRSTVLAIGGWSLVVLAAIQSRMREPLFTLGIGFFLLAHAMESTVLPLEIYFEHRNYLPSAGLLLATTALLLAARRALPSATTGFRATGFALMVAVPVVQWVATHGRARVWSSEETLFAQELRYNAESPRLRSLLATRAIQAGAFDVAIEHIRAAESAYAGRHRMATTLWRIAADCTAERALDSEAIARIESARDETIDFPAMVGLGLVQQLAADGRCRAVDLAQLADQLEPWAMEPDLPTTSQEVWQGRLQLARINAGIERYDRALPLARSAFEGSGRNPYIGLLLFQLHMSLGDRASAHVLLPELEAAAGRGDSSFDGAVEGFRKALAGTQDGQGNQDGNSE
jgi:hypothetical protein